jgi:hypothetical protein
MATRAELRQRIIAVRSELAQILRELDRPFDDEAPAAPKMTRPEIQELARAAAIRQARRRGIKI